MLSTYLNDNLASPYPFMSGTGYPFNESLFIGASVTVVYAEESMPANLHISSISISNNGCFATLMCDEGVLGVFERRDNSDVCIFKQYAHSDISVYGALFIGSIPKGINETYTGEFYFDQSCVQYIENKLINKYETYSVNGETFKTPQVFNIEVSGLLGFSGGTITGEKAQELSEMDALFDLPNIKGTVGVSSINDIDVTADGGYTLKIGSGSAGISLQDVYEEGNPVILIEITGDKQFPNCYEAEQDNAGTERT